MATSLMQARRRNAKIARYGNEAMKYLRERGYDPSDAQIWIDNSGFVSFKGMKVRRTNREGGTFYDVPAISREKREEKERAERRAQAEHHRRVAARRKERLASEKTLREERLEKAKAQVQARTVKPSKPTLVLGTPSDPERGRTSGASQPRSPTPGGNGNVAATGQPSQQPQQPQQGRLVPLRAAATVRGNTLVLLLQEA